MLAIVLVVCMLSASVVYGEENPQKDKSEKPGWVAGLDGVTQEDLDKAQAEKNDSQNPEVTVAKNGEQKIPILMYHHITTDTFDRDNAISLISPEDFRLHMTALKVHFNPISLKQYDAYINCTDGSVTLPENPVIITFDDGYTSNYEIAYPILKELEIPATIFVVTDTVGEQAGGGKVNYSHFTWEQAKEMEASGLIDIQSHSHSHVHMAELSYDEMVKEFRKSKYLIEKNLGKACTMFAYPYGSYNQDTIDAARKAGYRVQVLVDDRTTEEEFEVNKVKDGVEGLKRITIAGYMGNVNVIELIRHVMSKRDA